VRHMVLRVLMVFATAIAAAPSALAGWVIHEVPELGFAGLFPKTPALEATSENGVSISRFAGANVGAMCLVVVGDYPVAVDPDAQTVASRDDFAKGVKAKITSSGRITFPRGTVNLPAMEFEAASATLAFRSMIIIDGARVYQVAAGVPIPDGDTAEMDACIRGFRLLPRS